jgi:hypothetical protein
MAKKVRRVRQPRPPVDIPFDDPPASRPPAGPAAPAARPAGRRATPEELAEEYAYVLKDLRRIFILAAAMFALLILLNLIL